MDKNGVDERKNIREQVQQIIAEHMSPRNFCRVLSESRLKDDLDFDSLEQIVLLMTVEAKLGISISSAYEKGVKTVGDLEDIVVEAKMTSKIKK